MPTVYVARQYERQHTPVFLGMFVAGNIGMLGGLGEMIFVSCR